jgi:hypothetical protein
MTRVSLMRRLKQHVGKLRQQRRNVIAIAVMVPAACLGVYFLPASRTPQATNTPDPNAPGSYAVSGTGNACTNPAVIPINAGNAQSGLREGKYYVTNDSWNASQYIGLSQRLYVCNYDLWYVVVTMNNATGDFSVKTSPNVQETWYPTPIKLSSLESITSQFSDIPPGAGSNYGVWEFEYDIWLNGIADNSSTEIMIWTYNDGQTPSGSLSGSFADAGHLYEVYRSSSPRQYIAFVDRRNNLSGKVNLLDFFNYVISKGWMPRSSTLYQICNGVELVSTNSRPEKFTINNFSIKTTTRS